MPRAAGILGLRGPSLRGLNLRGASLRGPGPRGPDLRDPGLWRQISEHCFFFKHIISIPQFLKKIFFLHTIDFIQHIMTHKVVRFYTIQHFEAVLH